MGIHPGDCERSLLHGFDSHMEHVIYMNILKLKNGSEEAEPLVKVTMMSLNQLMQGLPGAIDAYELVEKCKDPDHKMFGDSEKHLIDAGLMEGPGRIHDSIRNVVLSAAVGDGLELHFESPIA